MIQGSANIAKFEQTTIFTTSRTLHGSIIKIFARTSIVVENNNCHLGLLKNRNLFVGLVFNEQVYLNLANCMRDLFFKGLVISHVRLENRTCILCYLKAKKLE